MNTVGMLTLIIDDGELECFEVTHDFDSRVYIDLHCKLCDRNWEIDGDYTVDKLLTIILEHLLGNRAHK